MSILFITNFFYPKPMANGVCIYQLAKAVVDIGEESHVICYKREEELSEEIVEEINIHRVALPAYHRWMFADESNTIGWLKKRIGIFISRIKKAIHILEYPLRDMEVVKRIVKRACNLIDNNDIDYVVCSYTPVEAIRAGQLIKRMSPKVELIYYSLDTLSNESGIGVLPEIIRRKSGIKKECKYFRTADKVILMNCHREHYNDLMYNEFRRKIYYADFPLFCPCKDPTERVIEKKEKTIVYAGSLYRGIRNPEYALEILCQVIESDFYIDFYGYSDCDDIISKFSKKTNNHIRIHGLVPYDEIQRELANSDVLLSIGNKGTQMAPSKIYEYISTGKPIIHVVSSKEDSCVEALRRYPNAYFIKEGEDPDLEKLRAFIETRSIIDTDELKKCYYQASPEFTISVILSRMGERDVKG